MATGLVEQDMAVLIDDAFGVFTGADEAEERIEQTGGLQGDLTIMFVDIE